MTGGTGLPAQGPSAERTVVGPVPEGRDPDEYDRARRRVLWSIPTGLFLIGSRAYLGGQWAFNLMTASLVVQVSVEPKLVGVSIDRTARTCRLVSESGTFSISLLDREDRAVVRRFVKPVADVHHDGAGRATALNGEPVIDAVTGSPILARAPAWLDCAVRHRIELGSHVLFVGEVVDVGGTAAGPERGGVTEVLRMEDTRMSYGG